MTRITDGYSIHAKVAIQGLNQALCINQSLWYIDGEWHLNRHLRIVAKRYSFQENKLMMLQS